jgi:tetratricopeptide (TPR) repeat protein
MAVDDGVDKSVDDRQKARWATDALWLLTKDEPRCETSQEMRHDVLKKLLRRIDRPYDPRTGDPQYDMKREEILFGLLRAEGDETLVQESVRGGAQSANRSLQVLLYRWKARLLRENKSVPLEVFRKLCEVSDVYSGFGTTELMKYALERGGPEYARDFLDKFPGWFIDGHKQRFTPLQDALRVAVASDADSPVQFDGTTKLLQALAEGATGDGDKEHQDNYLEMKKRVQFALNQYCFAPQRRPEDLAGIRGVLAAIEDETKAPYVYEVFTTALRSSQKAIVERAVIEGRIDEAIAAYQDLLKRDPKEEAEWRFALGRLYVDNLHQYKKGLEELDAAIKLRSDQLAYYEKRADAHRKLGQADDAIRDYREAITRLDATKGVKNVGTVQKRRNLNHRLAFAHMLKGDAKQAEDLITDVVQATSVPKDKAGTQENLGIVLLQQRKWEDALENCDVVRKLYQDMAWNWMIRYIAAKELKDEDKARGALAQWDALRKPPKRIGSDMAGLYDIIPDLLKRHFGVQEVIDDSLQGPANLRVKFGRNPEKTLSTAKSHPLFCMKGRRYIIDMESTVIDAYLVLQDRSGKVLADDDHSGGGRNARIDFTPKEDGDVEIIATSFGGRAQGAYTLIIRTPTEGK